MEVCKIRKEVSFKNGHDAEFEFTLVRSDREWEYGNGTSVVMLDKNSLHVARGVFDTRYDVSLRADGSNFADWVEEYLRYRFEGLTA